MYPIENGTCVQTCQLNFESSATDITQSCYFDVWTVYIVFGNFLVDLLYIVTPQLPYSMYQSIVPGFLSVALSILAAATAGCEMRKAGLTYT